MMKTCPINGCTNKEGMCIHKKMMMAMVIMVIVVLAFIALSSSKGKQSVNTQNNLNETTSVQNENKTNTIAGSYESYAPEKLAFAETGNVVLFFRASWCPTCRALDKNIKENLGSIPTNLKILDVDYDNSSALKQKYGVTTQHTLVQVDKDGNMISKWSGSPTLSDLVSQVK